MTSDTRGFVDYFWHAYNDIDSESLDLITHVVGWEKTKLRTAKLDCLFVIYSLFWLVKKTAFFYRNRLKMNPIFIL